MKEYIKPDAEYIVLVVQEQITGYIDGSMGVEENPFD